MDFQQTTRNIILGIIAVILAGGMSVLVSSAITVSHDMTSICQHETLKGSCG
jgi:hypothetical protein